MNDGNAGPFLSGLAVGLALLAMVWLVVADPFNGSSDGGSGEARLSGAGPSPTASTPSVQHPAVADRMQGCADAAEAVGRTLRQATASLDQWEVHVGAMNQLVVGAISPQQATAFWNQTRVGAQRKIDSFEHAVRRLQRHGMDCPPPSMLPSGVSPRVRSCARQVAADVRVLGRAQTAIHTWRRHVGAMEMLRNGSMSVATAGRMWLAMWQRGQHEIDAYRVAARAAHRAHACPSGAELSATASP